MTQFRSGEIGLKALLDRIMDKGVAIDANVRVDLSGFRLLGVRAQLILASFKIAEKIGLGFPERTVSNAPIWRTLISNKQCPVCGKESRQEDLKEGCPWCGWNYGPDER